MIKISTKGRYGTRLMLNLAKSYTQDQKPILIKKISQEEGVSSHYLEQIVVSLKISKLLKSARGSGGGFFLARPPSEIKLIEIIEAVEGPICLVDCVDDPEFCNRIPQCSVYDVWTELSEIIRDYLTKTTLLDLTKRSYKKST